MTSAFADTCYWVALTNPRDFSHDSALSLSRSIGDLEIVTNEAVLIEYLNFFAEWGPRFRKKAVDNVRNMRRRPTVKILPVTSEAVDAGIALYAARLDKGYSLTDCISMTMMRREGIDAALTNDRHFEQEGFQVLL